MLVPAGLPSYARALQAGVEVYHAMKRVMAGRGLTTNVGDEGGFAPDLATNEAAIELLVEGIEAAGYTLNDDIGIALDVAATELYREGRYRIEGKDLTSEEMIEFLADLGRSHALVSIEDGMSEDDLMAGRPSPPFLEMVSNSWVTTSSSRTSRSCSVG
jgi:enolase